MAASLFRRGTEQVGQAVPDVAGLSRVRHSLTYPATRLSSMHIRSNEFGEQHKGTKKVGQAVPDVSRVRHSLTYPAEGCPVCHYQYCVPGIHSKEMSCVPFF